MKKIKSMLAILMIIALSVSSMFSTVAVSPEIEVAIDSRQEIIPDGEDGPINGDKKIECTATIEDDFDDDTLLVVLKNEASLDFYNDSMDFSEINPKSLEELSAYKSEEIYNTFESKKTEYISDFKKVSSESKLTRNNLVGATLENDKIIVENAELIAKNEINEEYSNFHKVICVELNTTGKQAVLDAISELEKNEDVLVAEPNYITEACKIPNDTYYYEQWGMENASLPDAWNIKTGSSSVLVGVIDDGIDASHYDLSSRINSTLSTSLVSGVSPYTSIDGHGTSVAGVIGAVGNNSYGISGVCWNVSLVSLQHSYSDGKTYVKEAVDAINYAEENNIPILNYSYSFKGNSTAFEAAVNNYSGILIVSAGNDNVNIDNSTDSVARYPSLFESSKIISVAAIGSDNYLTDFSNYGVNSVDIAAPGKDIYTTVNGGGYDYVDGTSFSAPYVAGVAALIKTLHPSISNYGIRKAILDSADVMTSLQGTNKTYGKLNAEAALDIAGTCYYTIQYKANGGTGSMANTTIRYGFYSRLRDLAYAKTGYNFKGWDARRVSDNKHRYYKKGVTSNEWYVEGTQPQGYEKQLYSNRASIAHTTLEYDDTVVMTAQWEPITYKIKFEKNGGYGSMSTKACLYDQRVTLQTNSFYKTGYQFDGWKVYKGETEENRTWLYKNGSTYKWYAENSQPAGYTMVKFSDGATISNITTVNDDVTHFIAQWVPNSYNINYEANGGSGSMLDSTGYSGQSVQLSANEFTKEHSKFIGWYIVDSDGYWSVTDDIEWADGNPNVDELKLYSDEDSVVYTAEYEGVELNAIAQWMLLGDVDLDGEISVLDVTAIQMYFAGRLTLTDEQIERGDFNEDGSFSIMDATAIQMYLSSAN